MMSASQIIEQSNEAARDAAMMGKVPAVVWDLDTIGEDLRAIPFLGDYIPYGWRAVESDEFNAMPGSEPYQRDGSPLFFVDASGMGGDGEAAMGFGEFCDAARNLIIEAEAEETMIGFGIVEAGQFQVYIGAYVKS
jgi:hypothetical protein